MMTSRAYSDDDMTPTVWRLAVTSHFFTFTCASWAQGWNPTGEEHSLDRKRRDERPFRCLWRPATKFISFSSVSARGICKRKNYKSISNSWSVIEFWHHLLFLNYRKQGTVLIFKGSSDTLQVPNSKKASQWLTHSTEMNVIYINLLRWTQMKAHQISAGIL